MHRQFEDQPTSKAEGAEVIRLGISSPVERPRRERLSSFRRTQSGTRSEDAVRKILSHAQIEVNGPNAWDPKMKREACDMVVAKGSLGLGEAYMYGLWDCEDLAGFFARVTSIDIWEKIPWNFSSVILYAQARLQNRQNMARAKKVGRIHYDLPVEVWQATLDETMTGSCAYYRLGNETLEEAQAAKKRLVFEKLGLLENQVLLDIGVGWGAFAGYAIEHHNARPIGVTISPVQRDYIHKRYGADAIDVRVVDYRDIALSEPVDRIISVEMFEQVGVRNFRKFFTIARQSLKTEGRMVLQTIVQHRPAWHIDPWMNKYIYPEGYLPTLGQIGTALHDIFHLEDVHDIGAHYDPTLVAWMSKFRKNKDSIRALGKERLGMDPEVFCRMWEYHYYCCAGAFRSRWITVHQYVLSPNGIPGGLPLIR